MRGEKGDLSEMKATAVAAQLRLAAGPLHAKERQLSGGDDHRTEVQN